MATYYAITGGGNWNAAETWNTASNQAVGNAPNAPLATDDVILDQYGGAVIVNHASQCNCKTLTVTHANANITLSTSMNLNIAGAWTLKTGMTLTGAGKITQTASGIVTSDGVTIPGLLATSGNVTMTLKGDLTVTGLFNTAGSSCTINRTGAGDGDYIYLYAGFTQTTSIVGTATIVLKGTGGIVTGNSGLITGINITIDCTDVTFASSMYYSGSKTLTYTAGTVTTTGHNLICSNCTLDTDRGATKVTWNTITFDDGSQTVTLASNLTCNTLTFTRPSAARTATFAGNYDITCGTLTFTPSNFAQILTLVSGRTLTVTTAINMNGNTAVNFTLQASSTSYANFVYTGGLSTCKIFAMHFTYIDAHASSVPIMNWHGGTLSNTLGITNITGANYQDLVGVL